MSARTRIRSTDGFKLNHLGNTVMTETFNYETFHEESYPGSCSCDHVVFTPYNGAWHSPPNAPTYWHGLAPDWLPFEKFAVPSNGTVVQLNRNKLPTSSKFGIIQIFAEFDESLAMFTRKFWRSLTYGSFTWGVLPFVSELKAILEAIAKFDSLFSTNFLYEDSLPFVIDNSFFDGPWAAANCRVVGSGVSRLTGRIVLPEQSEAQRLLDYLGFHPDLATVWDLVPLSFMVDWFLPVGNLISSFHSRGWIRSVKFFGWSTIKSSGTISWTTAYDGHPMGGASVPFRAFRRRFLACDLQIDEIKDPTALLDLRIPSFEQLFNTFYLLWLGRKTRL